MKAPAHIPRRVLPGGCLIPDIDFRVSEKRERPTLVDHLRREQPAPRDVINLMDALHRSIQAVEAAPAQAKKGRKRVEGQKEMLLAIEGKQGSREAAKKSAKSGARQRKTG